MKNSKASTFVMLAQAGMEKAKAKKNEPYAGPFPRKKHSHRCKGCAARGQVNAVACYKQHCTKPQVVENCSWCKGGK